MSLRLNGSTSGYVEIDAPAVAGTTNVTLPATSGEAIIKATDGSVDLGSVEIDSSGRLLVGTSTARSNFFNTSFATQLQLEGTSSASSSSAFISNFNGTGGEAYCVFAKSRGSTVGSNTIVQSSDVLGTVAFQGSDGTQFVDGAYIRCEVDGTPGANDMPGRLVFSTTPDAGSSPTERMRIRQDGYIYIGNGFNNTNHRISGINDVQGDIFLVISAYQASGGSNSDTAAFYGVSGSLGSATATAIRVGSNTSTSRSLNASGTLNASGADYAEYMSKAGEFEIAKGDVCGVTADGKLTNVFADAVGFLVKSTNPSYVGGDTWGSENVVGVKPDADDVDALATWEAALEVERQKVDRIAFAGQVPVNVVGATPGQYIVPIVTEEGGITGIAKDEADLTLPEYMRAVGKVIAIEDDGRARIIVKVA
jgi:hypothetical protein